MLNDRDAAVAIGSMNRRDWDPIDKNLKRDYENKPGICIFNIYNQGWFRSLGGLGTYYIPPTDDHGSVNPDDWDTHSKALVIPAAVFEHFDTGDAHMRINFISGLDIAHDILGDGSTYLGGSNSLADWGVFIAVGQKPTEKELSEAKRKLIATLNRALAEGDRLWRGTTAEKNSVGDYHRRAASYLKQYREWNTSVDQNVACEYCGQYIKVGIAKCPHCAAILDHDKWEKAQARVTKGAVVSKP